MYPLGHYPQLLPLIGAPEEVDLAYLSPGEIAQAEFVLKHGTERRYQELIDGLSKQIDGLREKDSLYSKIGIFAKNTIVDELEAVLPELDAARPDLAPHAAIYGRRFPRDNRDRPITGRVLSVSVSGEVGKVVDSTGIFGDSYWASATPEGRLTGRKLTMTSGPRKGQSYLITTHVYEGATPFIRVEDVTGASIAGVVVGNKFKIDGDGLPQDDLDKWDRGNDWMIVSAIRGTLTAVDGGSKKITCDAVFDHAGYWLDPEGTIVPGNLKGRTITVDGVGDFLITAHDPTAIGGGTVTLESVAGIAGTETFRIQARSPADTGKQEHGSLRSENLLEPTCVVRVTPSSVASLGADRAALVRGAQEQVKRYARLRWHRFRGTVIQLRYLSRNAIAAVTQLEDEQRIGDDIRQMIGALDLQIQEPEEVNPPAEIPE